MTLSTQQKISFITLALSTVALLSGEVLQYGKHLATFFPCTTNPTNSSYCYAAYDAAIYSALGLIITFCIIGLAIDVFRKQTRNN